MPGHVIWIARVHSRRMMRHDPILWPSNTSGHSAYLAMKSFASLSHKIDELLDNNRLIAAPGSERMTAVGCTGPLMARYATPSLFILGPAAQEIPSWYEAMQFRDGS